jgi:hypothetical protein
MISTCKALLKSRQSHGDVLGSVFATLTVLAILGLLTTPGEATSANDTQCHVVVCGLRG